MEYPCFDQGHRLTFYLTRFKTGQLHPWFVCHDCEGQSNWISQDKIPDKYLETIDQWEWRGHFGGMPYLGRQATNCPKPDAPTGSPDPGIEVLKVKLKNVEEHRDRLLLALEKQTMELLELRKKVRSQVFTGMKGRRP